MQNPALITPAKRLTVAAAPNVDHNFRLLGGMGQAICRFRAATGGHVVLTQEDGSELDLTVANNEIIEGHFIRARYGNRAVETSAAGTYPGTLEGGEELVLRFDEGSADDFDTGEVTIVFEAEDVTQALAIARINAAMEAHSQALRPHQGYAPKVWATDAGGDTTSLTGRAGGTGASVEIVSIDAALEAMLGFSVGTTAGTNFSGPAAPATMLLEW